MKPLAAIVLCAGRGARMKSAQPKALHPILGRPLAYYPLSVALEIGASPVVAVIGSPAEPIEAKLQGLFPKQALRFAVQAEPKGTADAVETARQVLGDFDGDLLILHGDVPLLRKGRLQQLLDAHRQGGSPLSLLTFRPPDPRGYPRVLRAWDRVQKIVEDEEVTLAQKALVECSGGIYVVDALFLGVALAAVAPRGAHRERHLADLFEVGARTGLAITTVEAKPEEVIGVHDRRELASVARVLQGRINAQHQIDGVTMVDATSTFIDGLVRLAPDVELGPNVMLHGTTRIGAGSRVGMGCVITDSELAAGVQILPHSILTGVTVGAGCTVGPFANVGDGVEVPPNTRVTGSVEKRSAAGVPSPPGRGPG